MKHQEKVSKRVDETRDKNHLEFFLELLSFVVCDAYKLKIWKKINNSKI